MMKVPCVKKPCKDCPFRQDSIKGWLGKDRASMFAANSNFVCHKNTRLQCAGHMLVRGEGNDFVQIAGRLNVDLELKGKELVFESEADFIEHHSW